MGIMEKITAAIDAAKARTVRNVSDLVQNPRQHLEMLNDRAKSYNANTHPVAHGGVLDNRPLTREEIEQKSMDLALALSHMGPARGRPAAPQDEALRLAQQRAALSVEKGGLGLPAENTAMDRAGAMGFNTDAFHATQADISKFKKNRVTPYGDRVFSSPDPEYAGQYADIDAAIAGNTPRVKGWKSKNAGDAGPNVMPLVLQDGTFRDWTHISPEYVTPLPSDGLRSRFAAFDPWRKTSAIAAAMGVAAPDLLAADNEQVIDAIRQRTK